MSWQKILMLPNNKIMAIDKILRLSKKCKDLTNQKFERLTVKKYIGRNKHGQTLWDCTCICGNKISACGCSLLSGHTKSCGCLQRDIISKIRFIHGLSDTTEYNIWRNMIQRCDNPNHPQYKWYGGRGIKVCERWYTFENFLKDMGTRPEGKTLDRWPDNDGNYKSKNVRWATPKEQRQNRRPASYGPYKQFWFRAWHKDMMCQFISNSQCGFAKQHRLDSANVSRCLNDKQKTCKGWVFQQFSN